MNRPTLALLLASDTSNASLGEPFHYLHITAKPVEINESHIRSLTWHSEYAERDEPHTALANLRLYCQNSSDNAKSGQSSYGWTTDFHQPFSVPLERSRSMVRVLSRIERQTNRLTQTLGKPESFAQYVLRVAKVLRVSTFVVFTDDPKPMLGRPRDFNA